MALNKEYVSGCLGMLRLLTLLLGLTATIAGIIGWDGASYVKDKYKHDSAVNICLSGKKCTSLDGEIVELGVALVVCVWIATVILVIVCLIIFSKLVEAIIMIVCGIIVIVAGSLCLTFGIEVINAHCSGTDVCVNLRRDKYQPVAFIIAGVVSVVNGLVYIYVGVKSI